MENLTLFDSLSQRLISYHPQAVSSTSRFVFDSVTVGLKLSQAGRRRRRPPELELESRPR